MISSTPFRRQARRLITPAVIIAMSVSLVLAGYDQAFAYIDPGSGSYFLQWLLAGLLAAAFALRMFWRNVVSYVGRLFGRSKEATDSDQPGSSNQN